jgi:integrase
MKNLRVPTYRRHKQSGQAVVTLPDGTGGRRDILLGKYRSARSRAEYARVISEWEANGRSIPPPDDAKADITVSELVERFWTTHAEQHYRRPDGSPSSELADYRLTLKPLRRLYGHTLARDFGALALKSVQKAIADGTWMNDKEKEKQAKRGKPIGCCRGVTNQRVGRIRRLFRWAVENELVPPSLLHGLQAVRGLQKGRSQARETEPVKPVPEAFVNAVLPYVRPQVAAMIQLQLATGMRPGEVVIMRAIDIDMKGRVWLYTPHAHKTAYRGHSRVVSIGPRGQAILRQWLRPELEAYLFSPREAMESFRAEQRRKKTPIQPSHANPRKRKLKRAPGERYTTFSYGRAIANGCRRADRAAHAKDPAVPADQVIIPQWHPHQLRHTKATEIRREAGLDAARAVLGHRSPAITETYAELDIGKAVSIMERLG